MRQNDRLSPVAKRAWKRLESGFPSWAAHLDTRDGELEFAVPAPLGSSAGHLVAFSNKDQLWVRFSPPNLCYPVDDENDMVSLIEKLTADEVVFKLVMKGGEWVETTLAKPHEKPESISGHSVRFVSWSGRFDRPF